MSTQKDPPTSGRLDAIVAQARRERATREQGYRDRALKMYPWICGRCRREFDRETVSQLTVHHRNHDHDHNPADGSNWELLCVYCHDNEHSRMVAAENLEMPTARNPDEPAATHKPFAGLEALLKGQQQGDRSNDE